MTQALSRVAIVGCGAVTERGHLPAAAAEGVTVSVFVDKDRARAEQLARQYQVPAVLDDYTQLEGKADAAIVAVPHHLHAKVTVDLLQRGIHVLVEKPMALTSAECETMIRAADKSEKQLAVGLMRRFLRSAEFARAAIATGMLGRIESFDVCDGFVHGWPVASPSYFRRQDSGGGTLMDFGAHAVDSVLWWLGEFASFDYFDDDYGGVEADCELRLVMKSGAQGIIELSRTRHLRRTAILTGESAMPEVGLHTNDVRLRPRAGGSHASGEAATTEQGGEQSYTDLMTAQLRDFLDAIHSGRPPRVTGVEGSRAVALIEACYARRQPLDLPWMNPATEETR